MFWNKKNPTERFIVKAFATAPPQFIRGKYVRFFLIIWAGFDARRSLRTLSNTPGFSTMHLACSVYLGNGKNDRRGFAVNKDSGREARTAVGRGWTCWWNTRVAVTFLVCYFFQPTRASDININTVCAGSGKAET